MDKVELSVILQQVASGELSPDDAALKLKNGADQGSRRICQGRYAPGHPAGCAGGYLWRGKNKGARSRHCADHAQNGQKTVLVTRITQETADFVRAGLPEEVPLDYNTLAQTCVIGEMPKPTGVGKIVVATGGTSDIPVAEEAAITAEGLGNDVKRLYDVGVSGIHRLLSHMDEIMSARCIVAVAGMEGALPSVIGGLADCPVIAVPTSVGYGASLGGIAALLSMLNSCASGVSVVNIDNGFGAGYMASMINHLK